MHVMRETWTDARLDDFRGDVDRRFDGVDKRFDKVEGEIGALRGEVNELRSEMKSGFESINRTMLHGVIALSAAYIAGFAAIVTQL
jgi:chromosome segregation ATPase